MMYLAASCSYELATLLRILDCTGRKLRLNRKDLAVPNKSM